MWIMECLHLMKVHPGLCTFVENSWKTEVTSNDTSFGVVNISCGIFQGDCFSPLLFIMSLIPLTFLLRKCSMGYILVSGHVINHLLYMDDLKLYAKSEREVILALTLECHLGLRNVLMLVHSFTQRESLQI